MNFRVLDPSEWHRLVEDGIEPFATEGLPPAPTAEDPGLWVMVVAEEGGQIVGCSSLVQTITNHWWITPSLRRRTPQAVVGLWAATKDVLDEHGVRVIHTTVPDVAIEVQAMLERFGFVPADGKLYVLAIEDAALNRRVG